MSEISVTIIYEGDIFTGIFNEEDTFGCILKYMNDKLDSKNGVYSLYIDGNICTEEEKLRDSCLNSSTLLYLKESELYSNFKYFEQYYNKWYNRISYGRFYQELQKHKNTGCMMDEHIIEYFCKIMLIFVENEDLDNLKLLLEKFPDLVDINYIFRGNYTILMCAAGANLEMVKFLLGLGARVNFEHYSGMDTLDCAACSGNVEIIKLLLEFGAVVDRKNCFCTSLIYAVSNGHIEVVKILLENGADINRRKYRPTRKGETFNDQSDDWRGKNALEMSIKRQNRDIFTTLVSFGADLNAPNPNNRTPLMYAKKKGYKFFIDELLKNGAI